MKKFLVILFTLSYSIYAQNTYNFLRLDTSPRAAALAGSFVANNDDPNVLFYNPAGIKNLEKRPISFSFFKHLLDINSASVTYSQEFEGIGRFAAAVQYINYGTFTEANDFGEKLGSFGAGEAAFIIGYANKIDKNFNYGISTKFIYSSIAGKYSTGIAFDLGLQYIIPDQNWSFGFAVLNLGTQIKSYFSTSEDLPLDIRFGLSKRLEHLPLTIFASLNKLNENQDNFADRFKQFSFGGEFRLSKSLKLRIGYDNEKRRELKIGTTAGLAGFNIGLGVLISKYNFDYAFSSMGSIGGFHRIGISTTFE